MKTLRVHIVYEEEYVEQLKEILESAGHSVLGWDYALSQFVDFSAKGQADAEVALVDGQAGVYEKREIIESLTKVRKNLPNLRLIVIFPVSLEKDENFISKLLTLSIYDMHFCDAYDIDDIENWFNHPKNYGDYNIETKDIKGTISETEKPKIQAVEQAVENEAIRSPGPPQPKPRVYKEYRAFAAKIVVITGVKGGVGKTDITVNLAAAFKEHIQNARICLLDFDFPYGGIARVLGLTPDSHLGDWITHSKVITEESVKSRVVHAYGIDIIPMAIKIQDSMEFQRRQAEVMLDALRRYYDVIIVDTSSFSEPALAAIGIASEVFFVCTHDIVSISATHAYKEDLINLYGVNPDKMSMFLNMVPTVEDISKQKIAEIFEDTPETGIPIIGYAPYDDTLRQYRNKRALIYNEKPGHSFSEGINMIMRSFGIEPGIAMNPIDSARRKAGGIMQVVQRISKLSLNKKSS